MAVLFSERMAREPSFESVCLGCGRFVEERVCITYPVLVDGSILLRERSTYHHG